MITSKSVDDNGNEATGTLDMSARKDGKMLYHIEGEERWWPNAERVK